MYKVTYKQSGAVELQVKYFKNRRVADMFVIELGAKFISLEEVDDDASDES